VTTCEAGSRLQQKRATASPGLRLRSLNIAPVEGFGVAGDSSFDDLKQSIPVGRALPTKLHYNQFAHPMNLLQAEQLLSQLGIDLGGEPGSYALDERGFANLVFDESIPVQIRFVENSLVLATSLATGVTMDEPALFPTLMSYQFMGLRTFGNVLSWNMDAETLILSRHVIGDGAEAIDLNRELEILLRATRRVQEDLHEILNGSETAEAETSLPASLFPRDGIPV